MRPNTPSLCDQNWSIFEMIYNVLSCSPHNSALGQNPPHSKFWSLHKTTPVSVTRTDPLLKWYATYDVLSNSPLNVVRKQLDFLDYLFNKWFYTDIKKWHTVFIFHFPDKVLWLAYEVKCYHKAWWEISQLHTELKWLRNRFYFGNYSLIFRVGKIAIVALNSATAIAINFRKNSEIFSRYFSARLPLFLSVHNLIIPLGNPASIIY